MVTQTCLLGNWLFFTLLCCHVAYLLTYLSTHPNVHINTHLIYSLLTFQKNAWIWTAARNIYSIHICKKFEDAMLCTVKARLLVDVIHQCAAHVFIISRNAQLRIIPILSMDNKYDKAYPRISLTLYATFHVCISRCEDNLKSVACRNLASVDLLDWQPNLYCWHSQRS